MPEDMTQFIVSVPDRNPDTLALLDDASGPDGVVRIVPEGAIAAISVDDSWLSRDDLEAFLVENPFPLTSDTWAEMTFFALLNFNESARNMPDGTPLITLRLLVDQEKQLVARSSIIALNNDEWTLEHWASPVNKNVLCDILRRWAEELVLLT